MRTYLCTETPVFGWISRGTLGRQPAGYSDIYWCEAKNGPTVYLKKTDEPRCQLCNQRLVDDPNRHDFVVHIEKKVAAKVAAKAGVAP